MPVVGRVVEVPSPPYGVVARSPYNPTNNKHALRAAASEGPRSDISFGMHSRTRGQGGAFLEDATSRVRAAEQHHTPWLA